MTEPTFDPLWLAANGWNVTAVDYDLVVCLYVHVAGSVQAVLDSNVWEWLVAQERLRVVVGSGVDAVICARQRT